MGYLEPMNAAVLFGFNDVRVTERPVPSPDPDEVLIKVAACGVSKRRVEESLHAYTFRCRSLPF